MTSFQRDEQGQDLIEYSLLLAFVALAVAAIVLGVGVDSRNIWGIANNQLANAAVQIQASQPAPAAPAAPPPQAPPQNDQDGPDRER